MLPVHASNGMHQTQPERSGLSNTHAVLVHTPPPHVRRTQQTPTSCFRGHQAPVDASSDAFYRKFAAFPGYDSRKTSVDSPGARRERHDLARGTAPLPSGALLGLLEAEHVHGCEHAALAALHEGLRDAHKHGVHVDEGARDEAQGSEDLDDDVVDQVEVAELREAFVPGLVGAHEDGRGIVGGDELEPDLHACGVAESAQLCTAGATMRVAQAGEGLGEITPFLGSLTNK